MLKSRNSKIIAILTVLLIAAIIGLVVLWNKNSSLSADNDEKQSEIYTLKGDLQQAQATPTPTPTPTATPVPTPTPKATPTPKVTPTPAATATATPKP